LALNIRKMVAFDLGQVVDLVEALTDESPVYRGKRFNRKRTTDFATHFCFGGANAFGYVAETEAEELVGFIAVHVGDSPTHDIRVAREVGLFVRQAYRGTSAAVRMIKAAEQEVLRYDADEFWLGVSTGIEPEKTTRLFEKLGFERASWGVMKEVKNNV